MLFKQLFVISYRMYCSLLRLQFTSSSLHKAIADGFWTHYKIFSTSLLTTAVALLNDHSNTIYFMGIWFWLLRTV